MDISAVSFEPTHLDKNILQKDLDVSNDQYSSVEVGKQGAGDNKYMMIDATQNQFNRHEDLTEHEADNNDNENKIMMEPPKTKEGRARVKWQTDSDESTQFPCNQSHMIPPSSNHECKGIRPQRTGERSSFVTIGLVGHPNAGKSSLINALAGRKVVSVSSTPGHTKHLQTIFLNPWTRLCDCPGLVFPTAGVPYPLQVLGGQINTAQVRETFSTLAYVGARYPLERSYNLDAPVSTSKPYPAPPSPTEEKISIENGENLKGCSTYRNIDNIGRSSTKSESKWSGFSLAEAYAIKRGYYTKKQIPDTHRAGNEILRDLQNGKIVFAVSPPLSSAIL